MSNRNHHAMTGTGRTYGLLRAAVGLVAASVAAPVFAGGLILYEVGTEDVGLASAGYGARAQDASTLLTNPAGMTRLDGKQTLVGVQAIVFDVSFTPDNNTSPELGSNDGGNPIGVVPGASAFYTQELSSDITVGIGLAGTFGLAEEYDNDWVGRYTVRETTLTGVSLLPSIAWQVNDKFSIGVSLNAMYGTFEDKVAINNIVGADGSLKLDDNVWGWGGNLGLMYEPSSDTRIGLTYTSEVDLDFKSNAQFAGLSPGLEALLDSRGLLNAPIDAGITVPQTAMASLYQQLDSQWALLASAGWQDWSRFGEVSISVDSSNPQSLKTVSSFQDTWHGAVGGQYQLSAPWRLNFGVAYDSGFYKDSDISPIIPSDSAWRFGVGGQKQVDESFQWGVSAEYLWGGTLDVNQQGNPPALGGRGDVVGEYSNARALFVAANFGWNF